MLQIIITNLSAEFKRKPAPRRVILEVIDICDALPVPAPEDDAVWADVPESVAVATLPPPPPPRPPHTRSNKTSTSSGVGTALEEQRRYRRDEAPCPAASKLCGGVRER